MIYQGDIDLLFEISAFRYVPRTWAQFLGPRVANNAEHTFRVLWIALTLAKHEKSENHEKILKLALLHDLAESRCGDTNYLSRQYVVRRETAAVKDMFADTVHEKEMIRLWEDYEKKESIEAKIVKDADTLDVELELREQEDNNAALIKNWNSTRKAIVYPKLFTKSAKRLWRKVHASNPHNWHTNSPNNRFGSGDWKTK